MPSVNSQYSAYNAGVAKTPSDMEFLEMQIKQLKLEISELKTLVLTHENQLNDRKKISNTYIDAILSKIDILKNIINTNMGNSEEFISQHLLMVESIEAQIKQTGKISDKQFKELNEIYLKQKRL